MSMRITNCPKVDQYVPVSTVAKPVTQTAEVAVKSASMSRGLAPCAVATGNDSNAVPMTMAVPKATGTSRTGSMAATSTYCHHRRHVGGIKVRNVRFVLGCPDVWLDPHLLAVVLELRV